MDKLLIKGSRTLTFNTFMLFVSLALVMPEVSALMPPEAMKYVLGVNALINLWIRMTAPQLEPTP